MTKQKIYTYLGTNGVITSPIYLEGIYSVKKLRLSADKGKILTNGVEKVFNIVIPEEDLIQWEEISLDENQ